MLQATSALLALHQQDHSISLGGFWGCPKLSANRADCLATPGSWPLTVRRLISRTACHTGTTVEVLRPMYYRYLGFQTTAIWLFNGVDRFAESLKVGPIPIRASHSGAALSCVGTHGKPGFLNHDLDVFVAFESKVCKIVKISYLCLTCHR